MERRAIYGASVARALLPLDVRAGAFGASGSPGVGQDADPMLSVSDQSAIAAAIKASAAPGSNAGAAGAGCMARGGHSCNKEL